MKSVQAHSYISRGQKSSKHKYVGFWNFVDLHMDKLRVVWQLGDNKLGRYTHQLLVLNQVITRPTNRVVEEGESGHFRRIATS